MLRIYLSGRLTIESAGRMFGPSEFPGQQGRTAFALLAGERGPLSRAALADALWGGSLPPSWETALSSIISKLRTLLLRAGLDGSDVLTTRDGCHELCLTAGTWIDHDAAADGIHAAEAALRAGDHATAYGPSAIALHIARRPFMPGEYGQWVEQRRAKLTSILVRALECRAEIYIRNAEHLLAVEVARDAVTREPFRETAWQLLMRAHAASGNTAEALRVYERCRSLIADELGVSPSPQTKAVHAELLHSL